MTSFTAADLKLGGRLMAACDAIASNHLRRAAGVFNEIADDLNAEAEATTGLLAPDEDDWSVPLPSIPTPIKAPRPAAAPADLQMCARGVHSFGQPDSVSGWRTCGVCGNVSIVDGNAGPVDMGMRQ